MVTQKIKPVIRSFVFSPLFLLCYFYPANAQEFLESLENDIAKLIDSSKTSVVTVASRFSHEISLETESGILSFFKAEVPKQSLSYINIGSGIVFDETGHILTRSSIVAGAESNLVTFSNGVESPAIFVGHDPETGFAVLKTQTEYLTPARLGDSNNIVPGAWNLMIGNSLGVYPSVVFGSINGIRNDGMIQISANLNPGNNGSPILNTKGEVVGLVAGQMSPRENLTDSFLESDFHATILAYPINWIKKITEDIIQHGYVRHGWLGVIGEPEGWKAKIKEIKKNSPAQQAGLVEGDVVVKFSDKNVNSISELARLVKYTPPGETVPVEYLRGEQTMYSNVKIGEWQIHDKKPETSVPAAKNLTLTEQERNQWILGRINELEKELNQLKKLMETR